MTREEIDAMERDIHAFAGKGCSSMEGDDPLWPCPYRDCPLCKVATALREARERECHHGWRGSVPVDGQSIATPCPTCGLKSLFIANGGHLTCASVPKDSFQGCQSPIVEDTVRALKSDRDRLAGENAAMRKHHATCHDDCGMAPR